MPPQLIPTGTVPDSRSVISGLPSGRRRSISNRCRSEAGLSHNKHYMNSTLFLHKTMRHPTPISRTSVPEYTAYLTMKFLAVTLLLTICAEMRRHSCLVWVAFPVLTRASSRSSASKCSSMFANLPQCRSGWSAS